MIRLRDLAADRRRDQMMKRISLLVVLLVAFTTAPAFAGIEIQKIAFNPHGADNGRNWHINKEHVHLINTGSRARNLRGWKIHDESRDNVYRFGDLRLAPGDTVTLRSGKGDDSAAVCEGGCPIYYYFHWDLEDYVWNNDGDTAILHKRDGKVVDRCSYSAADQNPKHC
jgi:hypothetical protein